MEMPRSDFDITMDEIAAAASFGEVDRLEAYVRATFASDVRVLQLERLIASKRFVLARGPEDDPPADGFGTDVL